MLNIIYGNKTLKFRLAGNNAKFKKEKILNFIVNFNILSKKKIT